MIFIYITTSNQEEAEKISTLLLEEKLIACANIFPIKSMYWWEGKIVKSQECILIVKTMEDNFDEISQLVKKVHSYQVPCITKIPIQADSKFFEWLQGQIRLRP